MSTYYPGDCCTPGATASGGSGSGSVASGSTPASSGDLQSTSHEFVDAHTISMATLLAKSGFSNAKIHEIDIDVRETIAGIPLSRGGGNDVLHGGGTRKWSGAITVNNEYREANDFILTMAAGDVVVISWSEIV